MLGGWRDFPENVYTHMHLPWTQTVSLCRPGEEVGVGQREPMGEEGRASVIFSTIKINKKTPKQISIVVTMYGVRWALQLLKESIGKAYECLTTTPST